MLERTGQTCVGDENLYVHAFRGGRVSVAYASGKVLGEGVMTKKATARRQFLQLHLDTAEGPRTVEVPFGSEAKALREAAATNAACSAPAFFLGDGMDALLAPVLPPRTAPKAELIAQQLFHVTDVDAMSPEAAFHLAAGISASESIPSGYAMVPLPADTFVLYDVRGKVVPVAGPLPMIVWKAPSARPWSSDKKALLARLQRVYAPLLSKIADPLLVPSVPRGPARVWAAPEL
jgi:hypothetical protein